LAKEDFKNFQNLAMPMVMTLSCPHGKTSPPSQQDLSTTIFYAPVTESAENALDPQIIPQESIYSIV
tara:strand:+ start:209 stop:409 length:201 start_codon:yes stop_codon:yes gene_type:complete